MSADSGPADNAADTNPSADASAPAAPPAAPDPTTEAEPDGDIKMDGPDKSVKR